jgi:predicted anti-sigma-YlaC factor YlaD
MDCESIRAAISASLDGEDAGVSADVTRAHLDGCAACRDWRERQHALTRRARLSGYALDHDLTARVLGALPAPAIRPSRVPVARRAALALVAAGQLAITVPLLIFGHDREAGLHAAHELGSFDLALAIAFAVGVVRPRLSAGLAWPCCVAALGLAGTAIADMAAGQTFGADEAQHLVAVAGALLLFWQSRALSSRTLPADSATVTAAPAAADAGGWSGDGQRAGEQGRPVARRDDVA